MGGEEGGVDGGGGVGESVEEGWACEDVGDVLLSISRLASLVSSEESRMKLTTCPGGLAAATGRPGQGSRLLLERRRAEEAALLLQLRKKKRCLGSRRRGTAAPLRRGRMAEAEVRRRRACRCGRALGCLVWGGGWEVLERESRVGSWT